MEVIVRVTPFTPCRNRPSFLTQLRRHELALLVRDVHEREDMRQEGTVALWQSFPGYDEARPFAPWARTVAVRQVFKVLRRSRGESPFPTA